MDPMELVKMRPIKSEDIDDVARIDKAILGTPRTEYWQNKIKMFETSSGIAPLVAEVEGKVVGFIVGETSGWEYGVPEEVGWIHIVGVDPEFQGKGIGAAMLREMLTNMQKLGVTSVYTLVNWKDGEMLRFFDRMGFDKGDMINLQRKL
jgi:ribosomal protein S18 acetylase RimI-like enzyme